MTATDAASPGTALAAGAVQSIDWAALAPPLLAALFGVGVLVADLFLEGTRKRLLGWTAAAGLALALLSLLPLVGEGRATFCLDGGAGPCGYTADAFALSVQLLVLGAALVVACMSMTAVEDEDLPRGEFWFLLLAASAGAALLPASRDLATLVVALEVASLPSFALVALRRSDGRSSEGALKFFVSSVTATAVLLLGVSFVYATTGSLHLADIARELPTADPRLSTLAAAGTALTLVGFAFKTAAVPFHFWVPETYVGAPLPVAAYLSVVGKAVGFSGLALVTVLGFRSYGHVWGPLLAALAALTMTVGNVAALRQRAGTADSAVRLLAWSSVGQAGYLLVPLAAAAYADEPGEAVGATVAYALMYGVVNLGAFACVALVRRGGGLRLSDLRGLGTRAPLTALLLAFFLLCLAGLPPGLVGLFAKVTVFRAAVDAGLGWLAAVMAVNVVIALAYYLRWTAVLFARAPEGPPLPAPGPARTAAPLTLAVAGTALLGLALSGAPQLILRFAGAALL
ncbi:NADH-quinone oxidoreductase subunit N [Streptomyces sulphureus]|uniref:NADH-quinone oxidoreductase subunit N n=1 Tax=Streptomyces sulphureus TaxID=47758 RepID=UPI00037B1D6B|nr:NADH-quinone oxidoreductase subunit N [Streptomyces sulphureus]